jgi:CcmD family protein
VEFAENIYMLSLFIAYTLVWLAVAGYVARLAIRQRRLEQTLAELRSTLGRSRP